MPSALATQAYVDPRDLGPQSPLSDLVRAYVQELADKGRSSRTVPAYARYLDELVGLLPGIT